MQRLNFTLDDVTVALLERLAADYYAGNKSRTVRAALESLATHIGHDGWVITGYVQTQGPGSVSCHTCGEEHRHGEVLYPPVFDRGQSPLALYAIPAEGRLALTTGVDK